MKEVFGDLFTTIKSPAYSGFCITTNGFVKNNGNAVMGRGIALEIQKYFPNIPATLGNAIKLHGNHTHLIRITDNFGPHSNGTCKAIYSFPVKHNWWEEADIDLIKRSCRELLDYLLPFDRILLPRPGCGNGKLDWQTQVKPVIEPILDDRVHIITWR